MRGGGGFRGQPLPGGGLALLAAFGAGGVAVPHNGLHSARHPLYGRHFVKHIFKTATRSIQLLPLR